MYVSSLCILLSLAMMYRKRRRKRYSVTVSRKRIGIVYSRGACVLGGACARSVCLDPPCHTARSTRVNSGSEASATSCHGNRSAARWSCLNSLSPTTGLITRGRGGGGRDQKTRHGRGFPLDEDDPPRRRDDPCLSTVWIFDPAQTPVRTWVIDWCRARYPDAISEQSQKTQNICITFIQCWTNVEDVGPTLYKCYTNVLCLSGYHTGSDVQSQKAVAVNWKSKQLLSFGITYMAVQMDSIVCPRLCCVILLCQGEKQ